MAFYDCVRTLQPYLAHPLPLVVLMFYACLLSQLISIHTLLLCPTLMPRQLTFSFTFMPVIWFQSLYLPRPIISVFSKFRRVPACLLKLCMSSSVL